ncbi:trypsin-like peptidase domain-containing protein [Solwaraspora sp. WMMD1047]|uniref:trypsin-like serine peptidase n=1 Tax=Solwaraspora sp. WMMD1047 TaxID=3016102 RepID=UPI0024172725|nr:trypsin-like peptidase domain-containing protein [Solwaraspora sp. WMMD1047]MDG4832325.1 trypsin-like peptidase domain-containing protein [Solwaraspora sp. WMMD1047]
MHKPRYVAAGICLVLATVLVVPTPAAAAPATGSTAVSSGLVPVYDADRGVAGMASGNAAADIITGYWTPARRATAIPARLVAPAVSDQAAPPAASTEKERLIAEPTKVDGASVAVAFSHAEGRVFYRNPVTGTNHSCSAGTVNSGKRRLVMTAGHCVHGGSGGQWMQNWVFYPGYQNGAGPAGAFPAYQLWAQSAWMNNSNLGYDYAVAITQTNAAGQRVVDRVGGNGLTVNPGRPFVTAIAYPSNFQNNEQQAFCQGTLSARSIFNRDQKLNCDMRFGASGGPWLRDYSDTSTLGIIVSNQSYSLNSDGSGPEYGPYYDNDTAALYNAAEAASP